MNWTTELEPVAFADILDAIDELEPEGLTGDAMDQLAAAKSGAKATIEELTLPDDVLIGVEFAGNTGTEPLPSVTTRIRQVEPPPEPEAAKSEENAEEEAPAPA